MFIHYLLQNPLYQTKRSLNFNTMVNPIIKFNPWFFFFSVFWLIKNKLWKIIPAWILLAIFSVNLFRFLLLHPPFEPTSDTFIIFASCMTFLPQFIFSFFVDKILLEEKKNIIWKYRANEAKQIKKIQPFNTVWFNLIVIFVLVTSLNLFNWRAQIVKETILHETPTEQIEKSNS